MKNQFLYLFLFIFILGVSSCASANSETKTRDLLVYVIENYPEKRMLFVYDPINNSQKQILAGWDIEEFSLSKNDRLAFSSLKDGHSSIYVLDYPFTENAPTEIALDIPAENTPISWSPDGHYLLFDSVRANSKKLSVWDGKSVSDIYEYHEQVFGVAWSPNGQVAFTDIYTFILPYDGDVSEIFVWNGKTTVSASQNPSGNDTHPAWSKDGQLAFLSERNEEYDIFIWDGTSKENGAPDVKTFINIAPEVTQYFSDPTWTNTDSIAFSGGSESDLHAQIYEWDGQTAKNISQNPSFHNGGQTWRNDGYWSFITFFSSGQNLYVRDNINQTVLETKGQYRPAWSHNGLLAFCVPEHPEWTLSIWNGKNIVEIAHGNFIAAKWNNGEDVFCSNG
ncbi:MAG TPA: hypothetical protein PLT08_15310 [Anaerolineales bacterium]|nr:hypothetical protein [Anaerolineales bacterium]